MAVSAARSKIAPRPSAAARCEAVLKTFSKTRGTPRMKVGRTAWRSSSSLVASPLCARTVRDFTQPDLDDPGEDVGQRQEEQRGGVVRRRRGCSSSADGDAELDHEVAVGEHAPLGAARWCPRCRSAWRGHPGPRWSVVRSSSVVGDVATEPHQDRRPRCRRRTTHGSAGAGSGRTSLTRATCVGALGDDRSGSGVLEDPADLFGRRGLVDRAPSHAPANQIA